MRIARKAGHTPITAATTPMRIARSLTGATPWVELLSVRIVELARDGELDPDGLTEAAVSTFEA